MKTRIIYVQIFILFILPYIIYGQLITPQKIYEMVSPAVMQIQVFDSDSTIYAWGTAVAVGDDGLIYTNMHIYKDAKWIKLVNGKDTICDVNVAGFDPDKDILILRIPKGIIHGIAVGNSDSVKIGEPVYALGNPQGLINTFSNGQLSGIRHNDEDQLQYTASTSPGSSGGALLNSKGELIGITSSYYKTGQNLNFAVPINYYINTAVVDQCDTSQTRLLKDIVEIYNSCTELKREDIQTRLESFKLSAASNRNTLYTAAKIFFNKQFTDCAISTCNIGILKYPYDKKFYLLRGNVYGSENINDSALDDYNSALQIDSLYESALFARALLLQENYKNYKSALKDYFTLVNMKEEWEFLYINISETYLMKQDTSEALRNILKSYLYSGSDEFFYFKRGQLFSDLKMYEEAVADFSSAISLNPENNLYYVSRAIANSKSGNHSKAITDYLKILSMNPVDDIALSNLGYEYFDLRDYADAEINFRKAISIDDMLFDPHIGLAITLLKLNKINDCKHTMFKALRLNPVLEKGMAGLDSLKKLDYFWSNDEINNIKEVFKIMGIIDSDMFAGWGDSDETISVPAIAKENTRVSSK